MGDYTTRYARRDDPDTSHAAAASTTEEHQSEAQLAVLGLYLYGPLTHDEMIREAGEAGILLTPSGLRTAVSKLVDQGLVRDSKQRKLTKYNRQTIVWVLTEEGRKLLRGAR